MRNVIFTMVTICIMNVSMSYADDMMILGNESPPGNFTHENGKITGLSVEVVQEIQRRIGNTTEIQLLPWARAYKTALRLPNVVLFSVARTLEREGKFHWIALVMRKPWAFYGKKGAGLQIKSLEDAKKVRAVGVLRDDIRADWLRQQGFTNLDEASEHEQNIEKLLRGRVDLIFYAPHGVAHHCRKLGIDFHEFEAVLFPHASLSYIAMSKNGTPPETVTLWQETAQQLKEDGTFEALAEEWATYTREQDGIEAEVKDGALNFWKE
jgi:polar amino acid transport system substrate-binding protein